MKKMNKGMLMAALICGVVQWGGTPVHASELQEFALDEYVVTAARTETKLVDTPANISVVDAQTIEERHYQDVSEVLKDVPGANVVDGGSGAYEKAISLNGDTRVLILVDGRRMDFASGTSTGRASFDMNLLPDVNMIERIEVLKGAGGALYGSDAVGGVVNIITKKIDANYGKVSVGYGSFGEKDYSAMYSIREGKTGVSVSASRNEKDYYKYRDLKTDSTKRWPLGSDNKNEKISLKFSQDFDDTTNLQIGYDFSKYEGLTVSHLANRDYYTEQYFLSSNEIENKNIYAKLNWLINEKDAGYLQYYHNELEYYSVDKLSEDLYGDKTEKSNALDLQQTFTISDTNKIVVGASWSDTNVNNIGHYNDGIDTLAFFINDTWEFAPTWTLNAGIRYDDHSEVGDENTLSAGINKKFDENSHIYINWGQVFNAPTTGDLFEYYEGTGWKTVGNPNLKAETGETWNIGYQTRLGKKTDFGISYFESDLEDAIDWITYYDEDFNEVSSVDNVDKQKKRGLELTLNHKLNDNVDLTASYTYIRVKNDEGLGYERDWNYMPNTYRVGVNYRDGKWDTNVWLRSGSGGATHTYPVGTWKTPTVSYGDSNYITVDMAITYKATKDLSFYAKGYNLFNEAYAEQAGVSNGSYKYPAQSRRFIVGAEYKF